MRNLDFCPISKNLFVYLAKLPRLGILSVPYYEGIVEDLEELAARSNIEFIRINTFGLPKEEADRLALQYADYPKIALGPTDYGYIEEQQQWMDEHTSEPWFEPGSHIHMLFAPSE